MYTLPSDVSFSVLCKLRGQQITDISLDSVFFQTCLLIGSVSENVRAMYIVLSVASLCVRNLCIY